MFKEVQDVQRLERQLDNSIFFGGMKMFVNRPKFERGKVTRRNQYGTSIHGKERMQEVPQRDQGDQKINDKGGRLRSYVEVVRAAVPGEDSLCNQKVDIQGDNRAVQRPVILNPTMEHKEWLQKAWVGRLKNRGMFERVEEELRWVIDPDINPRYWVDDWIILPNMNDDKAIRLMNEEKMNGSTPILDLQKWSQGIRPTHRLAWVLLWGLPPFAWEVEYMERVVAEIGELVEVDEMVEERRRMDAVRILIRTKLRPGSQTAVPAVIDGVGLVLDVVEDMNGVGMKPKPKQPNSWFPPSPFSAEPNSPVTVAGHSPGADIDGDFTDGGSDDTDGGYCKHWSHSQTFHACRDQWASVAVAWTGPSLTGRTWPNLMTTTNSRTIISCKRRTVCLRNPTTVTCFRKGKH